jgi:hypothetical protein
MTGIAQTGAQLELNSLTGNAVPVVAGSAPTWIPGLYWINSSGGYSVNQWNGSSWVAAGSNYLALLTADPTGQTTIAGLTECGDSGYARIAVVWNNATAAYPSITANTSLLAFGPFTVNMSLGAQWLALVTVLSGTVGFLLNTWTLSTPQQVSATQTIDIAAGALQMIVS